MRVSNGAGYGIAIRCLGLNATTIFNNIFESRIQTSSGCAVFLRIDGYVFLDRVRFEMRTQPIPFEHWV
jgi:hypothetical protein